MQIQSQPSYHLFQSLKNCAHEEEDGYKIRVVQLSIGSILFNTTASIVRLVTSCIFISLHALFGLFAIETMKMHARVTSEYICVTYGIHLLWERFIASEPSITVDVDELSYRRSRGWNTEQFISHDDFGSIALFFAQNPVSPMMKQVYCAFRALYQALNRSSAKEPDKLLSYMMNQLDDVVLMQHFYRFIAFELIRNILRLEGENLHSNAFKKWSMISNKPNAYWLDHFKVLKGVWDDMCSSPQFASLSNNELYEVVSGFLAIRWLEDFYKEESENLESGATSQYVEDAKAAVDEHDPLTDRKVFDDFLLRLEPFAMPLYKDSSGLNRICLFLRSFTDCADVPKAQSFQRILAATNHLYG